MKGGAKLATLMQRGAGWWLPGATLDLDLMGNRSFLNGAEGLAVPRLSCTRAGDGALGQNLDGSWTSFLANTLRRTNQGLLIEEARTNKLANNSNTGATAGVIGSGGVVPTGTVANISTTGLNREVMIGINPATELPRWGMRFFGTAGATNDVSVEFNTSALSPVAATGEIWLASGWFQLVVNSGATPTSTRLQIQERDAAYAFLANTSITFAVGNLVPVVAVRTFNQATTAKILAGIFATATSGQTYDFTIWSEGYAAENGFASTGAAFQTSPILTTAGAVTRAADVVTFAGGNNAIVIGSASMFFQTFGQEGLGSASPRLIDMSNDVLATPSATTISSNDGTNGVIGTLGSGNMAGTVKSAFGLDNVSQTVIANGGSKSTQATSLWATNAIGQTARLGNRSDTTRALNGYMQRAAFAFPKGIFDGLTT